jgi:hypothetical protein
MLLQGCDTVAAVIEGVNELPEGKLLCITARRGDATRKIAKPLCDGVVFIEYKRKPPRLRFGGFATSLMTHPPCGDARRGVACSSPDCFGADCNRLERTGADTLSFCGTTDRVPRDVCMTSNPPVHFSHRLAVAARNAQEAIRILTAGPGIRTMLARSYVNGEDIDWVKCMMAGHGAAWNC